MLQNFYPLYRLVRAILIAIIPILIILFSVSVRLPDAQLHKDALKNSSFYTDLSAELKVYNPGFDPKNAFLSLVIASTVDEFATPGWIQNFSEKNIDLTTAWFRGDLNDWVLYLPTQDINLAVAGKIDAKTKAFSDRYGTNVPTCTPNQEIKLKENGFDQKDDEFCLPKSVKDGDKSLSEFFEFGKNGNPNTNLLDNIFKADFLTGLNENLKLESVVTNNAKGSRYAWFNTARDYFVLIRSFILWFLGAAGVAILGLLIFAKSIGKKFFVEFRKILLFIAYTTLVMTTSIILFTGLSTYFTSSVQLSFLPGLGGSKIISILSWQLTLFTFNILSTAIYVALGFIVISMILWVVGRFSFLTRVRQKNANLENRSVNNMQNNTLDGEFKRVVVSVDPESGSEFQNHGIIENFEMPELNPNYKSVTFNYDDVLLQENKGDGGHNQSVTFTKIDTPSVDMDGVEKTLNHLPKPGQNPIDPEQNTPPSKNITWF